MPIGKMILPQVQSSGSSKQLSSENTFLTSAAAAATADSWRPAEKPAGIKKAKIPNFFKSSPFLCRDLYVLASAARIVFRVSCIAWRHRQVEGFRIRRSHVLAAGSEADPATPVANQAPEATPEADASAQAAGAADGSAPK